MTSKTINPLCEAFTCLSDVHPNPDSVHPIRGYVDRVFVNTVLVDKTREGFNPEIFVVVLRNAELAVRAISKAFVAFPDTDHVNKACRVYAFVADKRQISLFGERDGMHNDVHLGDMILDPDGDVSWVGSAIYSLTSYEVMSVVRVLQGLESVIDQIRNTEFSASETQ